ncbi:MAG: hypothetical protein ACC655_07285 [Rhodothermia bacterium]
MKPILLGVAIVSLFALQTTAQTPRTISHQGRLTDAVGQPLTDSTWAMKFVIYDGPNAVSSSLWSQTSGVQTKGGIYNIVLGPITGVDFDQPLWLGVTVHPAGGESEITPRTPLTSVPASFALVLPYRAKANTSAPVLSVENTGSGLGFYSADSVLIETTDLTPTGAALHDDDLIIEARDAIVGLYSNSGGVFGSGIVFGEIAGFGTLTDKWAMVRETSGAASRLLFTFGGSADYKANPMKVWFDTLGQVYGSAYVYSAPKIGYASLDAHAFHPLQVDASTLWVNSDVTDSGYFVDHNLFAGRAGASIQLPNGAIVTRLTCEITDNDATFNLDCALVRNEASGHFDLARVTSAGSGGQSLYHDTSISLSTIQNNAFGYSVVVENATSWATAGKDLAIHRVFVVYTLGQVP